MEKNLHKRIRIPSTHYKECRRNPFQESAFRNRYLRRELKSDLLKEIAHETSPETESDTVYSIYHNQCCAECNEYV
jgi:hypothetical protein